MKDDPPGLFTAGRRVLVDAMRLTGRTGRLAAAEAGLVARRGGKLLAILFVALAAGTAGFGLLFAGLGILVGEAIGSLPGGLAIVGGVFIGIACGLAAWAARRLADPDLRFPVTRREIESDFRWLKEQNETDA